MLFSSAAKGNYDCLVVVQSWYRNNFNDLHVYRRQHAASSQELCEAISMLTCAQ